MLKQIGATPVNFKGTIVTNDILKSTIEIAEKQTKDMRMPSDIDAVYVATALDYILNKTPETDVFELQRSRSNTSGYDTVKLLRNGEVATESTINYGSVNAVGKAGISAMGQLTLQDNVKSANNETADKIAEVDRKMRKSQNDYWKKHAALKKEYEEKQKDLYNELEKEQKSLSDQRISLFKKRMQESLVYLKDMAQKAGV